MKLKQRFVKWLLKEYKQEIEDQLTIMYRHVRLTEKTVGEINDELDEIHVEIAALERKVRVLGYQGEV